jgi:arabinose-5-phosphate isomerase
MKDSLLEEGLRVLKLEAKSIIDTAERLNQEFVNSVQLIVKTKGKLVITGMGKSGHVARKLSATFSSTGTPSVYIHPAESSHGDMGVITNEDLIVAISYGGESSELFPILEFAQRRNIPMIALTGTPTSTLAKAAQSVLDISVKEEACPLGLAPTASTTVSLALGDALAMAVLQAKGFNQKDFAEFHPGGKLGRKLLLKVSDLMHKESALPLISPEEKMANVIVRMTAQEVRGVAGVVDTDGQLIGSITDGDIRRRLQKTHFSLDETARDWMSHQPKTIDCNELAEKALFFMEQFKVDRLFVVDKSTAKPHKAIGLIHIQDLLQANIR